VGKLLDHINHPSDLRELTTQQLQQLSQEVREFMISTVSATGGHLAASLGVVELAIAIHYVFKSPRDKIIWDVGHQAYAHKLLTGRRDRFHTLRQMGGISGFPRRVESEHDAFDTGHGSTAVAAGLGMAAARDLAGEDYSVLAVVGDGAMSGGPSLEAVNYGGHLKTKIIVVLNDNQMSISRNVGALAGYLNRLRLDPYYLRVKSDFEHIANRLPLGESLIDAVERFKQGVKQFLLPGMVFEQLGFTYLGPIDGHDIPALVDTLSKARTIEGPVLVHAFTQKGRGYTHAENDAAHWHRTPAFDIETGDPITPAQGLAYTSVFGRTLAELAEQDPRVVAVTAAMRKDTGLQEFADRFPDRVFDVGMTEQLAVTFAAGLAAQGRRPVAAIYSTFLQRSYDQIVHDVALPRLPVVLALDRAGLVGEDGPTHHGAFDLSYLGHIPNLVVMAPKDLSEFAAMVHTAIEIDGPSAIRYPRGVGENPPLSLPDTLPVGQAELLRQGSDVLLVGIGSMVSRAVAAAEELDSQGIHAAVVNARFVKPLDADLICELAASCGRLVTLEENALRGGFGSGVAQLLHARGISIPVLSLGLPDEFISHGPRDRLLQTIGLDVESITDRVARFLEMPVTGRKS
jgi:1-deoxy-D-xylulose-5-phosphate synthase